MIKQDDILELEIEKPVYEGVFLAKYQGTVVFVSGALPNEKIKAKVLKVNKNYIKAKCIEIIEPSKHRIKPFCPMSKPCGGCDLAFIDYDYLVELKNEVVSEIFQEFNGVQILPFIKSPLDKNYRMKTQYPVSETKESKRVVAGYFKENTHEIVNIKFCPIQPPLIDEIVQFIRENWTLSCYIEKKHKGLLRHINTRVSAYNNDVLITLVLNINEKDFQKINSEIIKFADLLTGKFPGIKGVLVNLNPEKTNKITGDKTILIKGENFIIEKLGKFQYKTGANSFFQINPKCAELLFQAAGDLIKNKGTLLDLYGGVGTIGIFLSEKATKITLVEENKEAVKFAKENFKLNNVLKYEVFENSAKDKMKEFIKEKKTFENIVIDPPRKGSDKETLDCISKMTNSIIYISCNPMTLKRDANYLIEKGFKLKTVTPVDMFPYTHHIEIVSYFERENV